LNLKHGGRFWDVRSAEGLVPIKDTMERDHRNHNRQCHYEQHGNHSQQDHHGPHGNIRGFIKVIMDRGIINITDIKVTVT
jgi:hypothetical protein